jgi:phage RecT family recombinase
MARPTRNSSQRQTPTREDASAKKISTALAIANVKLGSGAASKFNAARITDNLKWQTEKMYVMQLIGRSDYLAQAIIETPISLLAALQDAASMGLSISPQLGHVYLIPQRPKQGAPLEVYAKVSYKGMEQSVLSSGTVLSITTELVYANDEFESGADMNGPYFTFKRARADRGDLEGGFCLARYANGEKHLEWMTVADIMGCKAAATKAQRGETPPVWVGAFATEQYKKCIVRRAAKHWPSSPVIERLIQNFDVGNPMDFDKANVIEGESVQVITDEQVNDIRLALPTLNDEQASLWMTMAAKARGFDAIRDMPADRFTEVRDSLVARLKMVEEREQKQASAGHDATKHLQGEQP